MGKANYAFLFIFLLVVCTRSNAAILFVDINNNLLEIETAKKAAIKRGEQLIIIPSLEKMPISERKKLRAIDDNIDKIQKAYYNCSRNCQQLQMKIDAKTAERDGLVLNRKINLEKDLSSIKQSTNADGITSIILSGHHGGGRFSGALGGFSSKIFIDSIKDKLPETAESVRSVNLWGCYTNSPGTVESVWKDSFQNLALVSGFHDLGPSQYKASNHQFLEGILVKEQELIRSADDKKMKSILSKIANISTTSAAVYLKNSCGNEYYADANTSKQNIRVRNFADTKNCQEDIFSKLYKKYVCYYEAKTTDCNDPPEQEGSTLRQFHALLQQISNLDECKQFLKNILGTNFSENTNISLLLIKYQKIKNNAVELFKKQFEETKIILQEMGISFPSADELKKMKRGEISTELEKLSKNIQGLANDKDKKIASRLQAGLNELLLQHDHYCLSSDSENLTSFAEDSPSKVADWPRCEIDTSIGNLVKSSIVLSDIEEKILSEKNDEKRIEHLLERIKLQDNIQTLKLTEYTTFPNDTIRANFENQVIEKRLTSEKNNTVLQQYADYLSAPDKNKDILRSIRDTFISNHKSDLEVSQDLLAMYSNIDYNENPHIKHLTNSLKAYNGEEPYKSDLISALSAEIELETKQMSSSEQAQLDDPNEEKENASMRIYSAYEIAYKKIALAVLKSL